MASNINNQKIFDECIKESKKLIKKYRIYNLEDELVSEEFFFGCLLYINKINDNFNFKAKELFELWNKRNKKIKGKN